MYTSLTNYYNWNIMNLHLRNRDVELYTEC